MKNLVIHVAVEDDEIDHLIDVLTTIVDDEEGNNQWTHASSDLGDPGMGGTFTQTPVRVDSFGLEDAG